MLYVVVPSGILQDLLYSEHSSSPPRPCLHRWQWMAQGGSLTTNAVGKIAHVDIDLQLKVAWICQEGQHPGGSLLDFLSPA